jgi:hypothetical protein
VELETRRPAAAAAAAAATLGSSHFAAREQRQINKANDESFSVHGSKLIAAAHATGSPVAVIVNWGYGEELYKDDPQEARRDYVGAIRSAAMTLSRGQLNFRP